MIASPTGFQILRFTGLAPPFPQPGCSLFGYGRQSKNGSCSANNPIMWLPLPGLDSVDTHGQNFSQTVPFSLLVDLNEKAPGIASRSHGDRGSRRERTATGFGGLPVQD